MTTQTKGRGWDLITAERQRQVLEEGWTIEKDMREGPHALFRAAYAYYGAVDGTVLPSLVWPWPEDMWKPKDRLRNLVRAGALAQASFDIGGGHQAAQLVGWCAQAIDRLNIPDRCSFDPTCELGSHDLKAHPCGTRASLHPVAAATGAGRGMPTTTETVHATPRELLCPVCFDRARLREVYANPQGFRWELCPDCLSRAGVWS